MPEYRVHAKFNILIALPVLLLILVYFLRPHPHFTITFAAAFIYSTLFMNPDLDLANKIRLFSIRGFLSIPFRLYARVFSHRGLSHNPIFGSATRILWLLGWAVLIFFIVYKSLPTKASFFKFYKLYQPFIIYGIAGICLADWGHILLDLKEK